MGTCPSCARENRDGAAFCGQCGARLAPQPAAGGGAESVAPATAHSDPALAAEPAAHRRTHPAVLVAALVGVVGLGGATAYKIATQRGRAVPPYDEQLRAQSRPNAEPVDDEPDAGEPDAGPAADAALAAADAQLADAGEPDAAPERVAQRAERPKRRVRRPPARRPPAAKSKGARPTNREIRACIDHRRARLRRCLEQSALRMEAPPGGIGRATLRPDGALTNMRVPGGGHFSSCVRGVLRTLRCRPFSGPSIEVSYPLRW